MTSPSSEKNEKSLSQNQKSASDAPKALPFSHKRSIPVRRKRNLMFATVLFVLIALIFLLMYVLIWRFEEETEDAYVTGSLLQVTAQVGGTVRAVNVHNTDSVKSGDVLVVLGDEDLSLNYESALDGLRTAVRQFRQQSAGVRQADALVSAKRAAYLQAHDAYKRRQSMAKSGAVSAEDLDRARTLDNTAFADWQSALAQRVSARAAIGKSELESQPAVLTAIARVKQSWLDLQRTQIVALQEGEIAKRAVEVGQKIGAGVPLMTVIPLDDVWVEANFKETQLKNIRIGQEVELVSDWYGDDVVYHGRVTGISAGTGSAFSLLPAQNATGNWIKIVQRIPVRIGLNPDELKAHPLRVGLSMMATVKTNSETVDQKVTPLRQQHSSQIDFAEVEAEIANILQE